MDLLDQEEVVLAGEVAQGSGFSTESQCGPTWAAQPVEQYDGSAGTPTYFVAYHESRVGYHVRAGCSGTLISDDLFLSAGHCGYRVGDLVRFDYQATPQGAPRPTRDFAVTQIVEQQNDADWDYAIVRLAGGPGREFGHANLSAAEPAVGSTVTIIGHPSERAKEIHAGTVISAPPQWGVNNFSYWVDTEPGSSGSGVLDGEGRLVGVHTSGGCFIGPSPQGNEGMRMSRLITRSPTLATLTRGKVLWRYLNTAWISLWSVDAAGAQLSYKEHNPGGAWSPLAYSNNRLTWRHADGRISIWTLDDAGNPLSFVEHGPFAGWTAVSVANDRVLWHNAAANRISLWTMSSSGAQVGYAEHSVSAGWVPVNYANNHILWRHSSGKISLWRLDDAGSFLSYSEFNPGNGWVPLSYENGQLLWRNPNGRASVWNLTRSNVQLSYNESTPPAGWTPLLLSDRKLAWRHSSGAFSQWNVNSYGGRLSEFAHNVGLDWSPVAIAGARP